MKNLMTCSIQKIATQAMIIGFLLAIFPLLSYAQDYPEATGGMDATVVYYDKGELRLISNKEWTHMHNKGHQGVYKETGRDQWSVYMTKENQWDKREITINLWKKVVTRKITKKTGAKEVTTVELGKVTYAYNQRADLEIIAQENAANRAYKLTNPLSNADLNNVMEWIGREVSRSAVDFCWKPTYGRGVGHTTKTACEASPEASQVKGCEKYLELWYPVCADDYEASGCCICSWKCPAVGDVMAGAQNLKYNCGPAACSTGPDGCFQAISDMVFAPIFLALNIVSFGLSGTAKNAAQKAALAGANAATGGASAAVSGVTKTALSTNWSRLLNALGKAEDVITGGIDIYDKFEYLKANVENFETEINRWNQSFADNFPEYTNQRIDLMINNRFPDPDDRKFIKRMYGQYQLVTMLEADGWRIAKTVLTVASYEPTGIISTIDAFAYPLCKSEPNPFPNVSIIPKKDRYKNYKEVKFHSQNSMTLAQAHSLAKQNSWIIATETEVKEAWVHRNLDVYAFGMTANGKFAVPVQADHSNFKKGPNIGASGGNQGFFYTIVSNQSASTTSPPATLTNYTGNKRIQNSWYKNHYVHNQNGKIEQGPIQSNWSSALWKIVPAHSGQVRIQNVWYPNKYIHNQNGKIEVGSIQPNWASALWKIVPAHSGWVRIQSSLYPDFYIHNQNGKIEVGPIQPNWASALWKVQ